MKPWFRMACLAAIVLASTTTAKAGVSFQIGTDDFFLSVGDYDYLPYAYLEAPGSPLPPISFRSMLRQYGTWIDVPPFGIVWRPYAAYGWRPYLYGHWIYTDYGLYWEGYEPWAWVGYHYGFWVFLPRFGWVWVPGYTWHPGRVVWAHGDGTIGWMPFPPDGYRYDRGRVRFVGRSTVFQYSDREFGQDFDSWDGGWFDPTPRRRSPFEDPANASINLQLWVFIDGDSFDEDNYADLELGPDYTREAFREQEVRFSTRPLERRVLEGIVQQRVSRVAVSERRVRADQKTIRMVVPSGSAPLERIREQSPQVVREVIAPAFADARRPFKGHDSKIQGPVNRIFRQEAERPTGPSRSREELARQARAAEAERMKRQSENLENSRRRVEAQKDKKRRPNETPQRPPDPSRPGPPAKQQDPDGARTMLPEPTPESRPVVRPQRENPVPTPAPEPVPPTSTRQTTPPPRRNERVPATRVPTLEPQPGPPVRPNRPSDHRARPQSRPESDAGDDAITDQALATVKATAPLSAPAIRIRTSGGVITVSGNASSPADAERILQALASVNGAKEVRNEMQIPRKNRR